MSHIQIAPAKGNPSQDGGPMVMGEDTNPSHPATGGRGFASGWDAAEQKDATFRVILIKTF